MPSPFPGVDPYIESQGYWPDFHHTCINYLREAIADALPDHYEARIDERLNVGDMGDMGDMGDIGYFMERRRAIRPDVAVLQRAPAPTGFSAPAGMLVMEPIAVPQLELDPPDDERQGYIKILRRPDRRVVTVIELLSPTNKGTGTGKGYDEYLRKRRELLAEEVHLVEIDLLLGGRRVPFARPLPPAHFYTFVSRSHRRQTCDVFPWTVRHPLPAIPIPLRAPDPDVLVNLGEVFTTAYEKGKYRKSLDYAQPLTVPLEADDLAWVVGVADAARVG